MEIGFLRIQRFYTLLLSKRLYVCINDTHSGFLEVYLPFGIKIAVIQTAGPNYLCMPNRAHLFGHRTELPHIRGAWGHRDEETLAQRLSDAQTILARMWNRVFSSTVALMAALRISGRASRDMARVIGQHYREAALRAAMAELEGH